MTDWTPEAVRDLRDRLGLTQQELADRVGCTRQAIWLWETGQRSPVKIYQRALDRIALEHDDDANR